MRGPEQTNLRPLLQQSPMNVIISEIPKFHFSPESSPPKFLIQLSRRKSKLLPSSHLKWLRNSRIPTPSSLVAFSVSDAASYSGWDDLTSSGDPGESDRLRNFLASLGIDDKKYAFVFLLGLVCALAISRVRVSSIVVFPASLLVFAVGFSLGFVHGGSVGEMSISGSKRKSKEDILRVFPEKLRSFVHFLDGFDVKVSNLKNDVQGAIDSRKVTVQDLESYVEDMESIRLLALNARNEAEGSIKYLGNKFGVLDENPKPIRRRKDLGQFGFDLLQIVRGVLGESPVYAKPNKVKDNVKQESVGAQSRGNSITTTDGDNVLHSVNDRRRNLNSDLDGRSVLGEEKMDMEDMDGNPRRSIRSEEYSYQKNRLRFINSQHVSLKMGHNAEGKMLEPLDSSIDSVDFNVSIKQMGSEYSFSQERVKKKSNGAYVYSRQKSKNETYKSMVREGREIRESDSQLEDLLPRDESGDGSSPSSTVSDDMMFDRYLREANSLLKQAKECLKSEEQRAEVILHRSARLLSKAINMKPMSLLAVGLLGNTYLLHGELKLKISRELRTILSEGTPTSIEKWGLLNGVDDQAITKEKIATVLIDACEESEQLLVKAGRQYRMALSIDGNDVRALYNWGLALSFRAQLIADIGPEAASDADKVFLAAIDKFDAMMSKGNVYAPDALFRWGVALQQRSRLRSSGNKEKVKLLQQAKRLYEDALDMDSSNFQVREALSSCASELKFRHF